jgi:hypothetical protein
LAGPSAGAVIAPPFCSPSIQPPPEIRGSAKWQLGSLIHHENLLAAVLLLVPVLSLTDATAAPTPQTSEADPQVVAGSAVASGGYTMTDSGANTHTFVGGTVVRGHYTTVIIDGTTYTWDPELKRYYRPGATPPDFSYYEFTPSGDGYTYKKKVPQTGGTATIESGTLV